MGRRRDFGATNQPGTCLWCGKKLRPYRWRNEPWAQERGLKLGGYGDGYFCGLNCGYDFGRALARLDKRLKETT